MEVFQNWSLNTCKADEFPSFQVKFTGVAVNGVCGKCIPILVQFYARKIGAYIGLFGFPNDAPVLLNQV